MPVKGQYSDSASADNTSFKDSQEAAFRRIIRSAIRSGPFTRAERDVTLAIFGHWFHHKGGPKSYIHPGRAKLAKKAKTTEKTVSRCLGKLRAGGIISAEGPLKGNRYKATEYEVDPAALLVFCGCDWVDFLRRNVPSKNLQMSHLQRDKMSHRISTVEHDEDRSSLVGGVKA